VQEVRGDGGDTEPAGAVEFVSDEVSYAILSGRWFHIIVLNVHAPTGHKIDEVRESFYE
jgi:hypothetical protein